MGPTADVVAEIVRSATLIKSKKLHTYSELIYI
jgi:hypothetical protein